jgi:hypothetical protein
MENAKKGPGWFRRTESFGDLWMDQKHVWRDIQNQSQWDYKKYCTQTWMDGWIIEPFSILGGYLGDIVKDTMGI